MRSGSFDSSQEGVDEMVHQLPWLSTTAPAVSQKRTCSHLREGERTELHATITSSNNEVIRQDNDCDNEEEMNEWGCYMEGKPTE